MKALFITLGFVALILTPLFVSTCKDSVKKKREQAAAEAAAEETTMDFTPKNRAQVVIDDRGILVIGFCWQDRPFLVASKSGMGEMACSFYGLKGGVNNGERNSWAKGPPLFQRRKRGMDVGHL